ncbi:hypothetical protein D041_3854B, partial [Vibrio parahaemolyticus EKP-008]
LSLSSQH